MSSSPTSSSSTDAAGTTYAGMLDVTCRVEVIVGTGSITVRDCLKLQRDSIIRLDAGRRLRSAGDGAGRARRRRGEIVVDDETTSVRISERAAAAGRRGAAVNGALVTAADHGQPGRGPRRCSRLFVWALRRGSLKLSSLAPTRDDRHRDGDVARRSPLARDCRRRRPAAADRPDADHHFAPDRSRAEAVVGEPGRSDGGSQPMKRARLRGARARSCSWCAGRPRTPRRSSSTSTSTASAAFPRRCSSSSC